MRLLFDFATNDLATWQAALVQTFGHTLLIRRRTPLGQLLKSIISSRTFDAVSTAAYNALIARFPTPDAIVAATSGEIELTISEVTFAADKAVYLQGALKVIRRDRPGYDLEFLALPSIEVALAWLERLPGVGRKVAASTLNASTLARPVFIVDTHVLRVLRRLGFVGPAADFRSASEAVTAAQRDWHGDDFLTFHILMKQLGQTICRWDVPLCEHCPLAADCATGAGRLELAQYNDRD